MNVITPHNYYHEQDKQTLEALKSIPGFTQALKAFMKIFNEKLLHGLHMASKIRLGPEQLPQYYNLLPPICQVLGINEPDFYLEMNPFPNAYTIGDTQISITVTSGLLQHMEEDEIIAVLAHECGHIACRHCLYHTMGDIILTHGSDLLGLDILSMPLKLAFYHWQRCSEFSADRAAAIYTQGSNAVVNTMIRLAGGDKSITNKINKELYLKQAEDYTDLINTSAWNKTLQYFALMEQNHPFASIRASEIQKWCESEHFAKVMEYKNQEPDKSVFYEQNNGHNCSCCGIALEEGWLFCRHCGNKL